jgi:D-alanyl-D-alanine carboxypeptidase
MVSRNTKCTRNLAFAWEGVVSKTTSYLDKVFVVIDQDARIRNPSDFMEFRRYTTNDTLPSGEQVGNFKRILPNTEVKVDDVEIVRAGTSGLIVFAHTMSKDGTTEYGWTSTRNFFGKFINETLGEIPPTGGAGKYGPNAAWEGGKYRGQRTLVEIVSAKVEIERIALDTLDAYLDLVSAAAKDGIEIAINSGFRSYTEQKRLYEGYQKGLPGYNVAAPPGNSKHQNGIAFDIRVAGGDGDPAYDWLKKNGPSHGFIRTVNKELWHWEYNRTKAAAAINAHTFKTSNVVV